MLVQILPDMDGLVSTCMVWLSSATSKAYLSTRHAPPRQSVLGLEPSAALLDCHRGRRSFAVNYRGYNSRQRELLGNDLLLREISLLSRTKRLRSVSEIMTFSLTPSECRPERRRRQYVHVLFPSE